MTDVRLIVFAVVVVIAAATVGVIWIVAPQQAHDGLSLLMHKR
jgi:hypothetical protein